MPLCDGELTKPLPPSWRKRPLGGRVLMLTIEKFESTRPRRTRRAHGVAWRKGRRVPRRGRGQARTCPHALANALMLDFRLPDSPRSCTRSKDFARGEYPPRSGGRSAIVSETLRIAGRWTRPIPPTLRACGSAHRSSPDAKECSHLRQWFYTTLRGPSVPSPGTRKG